MNFVFENTETHQNFLSCPDVNGSNIRRFTPSPVVTTLLRFNTLKELWINLIFESISVSNNPNKYSKYVIASGVTHSPWDWCGPAKKNLFSFLKEEYLRDLRLGKAFLLLDQSHEGYHEDWMFAELHNSCTEYNINPNQLIYVTGNLEESRQYNRWIDTVDATGKMLIVPVAHFEPMINETALNRVRIHKLPLLPTVDDHIKYKTEHLEKIKTFNCLQKRPRAHRIWMFKELVDNNLLECGISSMNALEYEHTYYMNRSMDIDDYNRISKYLPMLPPTNEAYEKEVNDFSDQDSGKYQLRFNEDLMLDTWVSVISEASFGEDTCFISEKTFKPIAACHPFILIGNRYSLRNLRDMGYRTFHPFIDETYDELDTWERYPAITDAIKKINNLSNNERLEWFKGMRDILEHNLSILKKNSENQTLEVFKLINAHYKGK
jgi:hypothetical protein